MQAARRLARAGALLLTGALPIAAAAFA